MYMYINKRQIVDDIELFPRCSAQYEPCKIVLFLVDEKILFDTDENGAQLITNIINLEDSSKEQISSIVEEFKEMNVEKGGPTHCSGREVKKDFKEN